MTAPSGSTPTNDSPPIPELGGRYRVHEPIGRGGMATVHRGFDTELHRPVAIKVLHPHLADDPRVRERFRREARAAARLQHEGVVAVYDKDDGSGDTAPYIVMELVEGGSAKQVLDVRGALTPGQALALLRPAAVGLARAHDRGLVHRDVTPANILVTTDGASKIGDFGLARAIAASTATFPEGIVGSPHYMAPEAVRGEPLDPRADVYALGCVLFHCLTDRPPFDGDSPQAIAMRHGVDPVPVPSRVRPGVPPALDEVVACATAHDPDERYADAGAFVAALDAAVPGGAEIIDLRDGVTDLVVLPEHATTVIDDHIPTTAVAAGAARPPRRWVRRTLAVLVTFAVLAGGGWLAYDRVYAPVTVVPGVIGIPVTEARAELEEAGFRVSVVDERVFDRDVPEGSVVAQSPTGRARRTAGVALTVSAGPRTGALPVLVGRQVDAAVGAVEALDLDLTVTTVDGFDDEVPPGTVLDATPTAGATVAEGDEVVLTVSAGPAPVDVPDVTGESQASATAQLVSLGLRVRVAETRFDGAVPEGGVIATTPEPGSTLRRGDEVSLVVSDGPAPVAVPDVVGERQRAAVAALEALGFTVDVRDVPSVNPFADGVVDAQDPSPGAERPRGSTVRIFVWRFGL